MLMNTDIPMDTKSRKIKDFLSHPVVDSGVLPPESLGLVSR